MLPNLDKTEVKSLPLGTTATSIKLQWDSWRGPLQSDHSLAYQVQYQAVAGVTGVNGNIVWTPWTNVTTLVTDNDGPYQTTTVSSLALNTFYKFRILPVVLITPETYVAGGYSAVSTILRTSCLGECLCI